MYHELSHASHYSQVSWGWYSTFVAAELHEIIANPSGQFNPYGTGTTSYSPIIALGEGWAYHIGHFLADQRYGTISSCQAEQTDAFGFGIFFCPNGTNHPNIDVLENFDPNLLTDPFRWIPKGLLEDMTDNTNEINPITDNVQGFTIQQLYLALQADVNSVEQYRTRFIQQNPGNQNQQTINLFGQYHY